jgi:hypothetical protein
MNSEYIKSMSSVVSAVSGQVSTDLDRETVILNLDSGFYFILNEVGSSIWKLIQQPKTVNEIENAILEEYEVEGDQCEIALLALLKQLKAEGLIEVKNETAA